MIVVSCSGPSHEMHDPGIKKKRDDYRALSQPPAQSRTILRKPKAKTQKPPLPPSFYQKVSLSLSGQIPLHEAFLDLAHQAHVNIVLDGNVPKSNNLFYCASRQNLIDVVENLCAIGGLRYYFEHNALHICKDTPYFQTHSIQFLLGSRKTQTQTSVKTDIFTDGTNRGMQDNGSCFSLNSSHNADFWDELEKNLAYVLSTQGKEKKSAYAINKYAGILSVYGTNKQQRMIESYLQQLQKLVTTQILIEAKIIEIDLTDEYKGGVNWNAFTAKNPEFLIRDKDGKIIGKRADYFSFSSPDSVHSEKSFSFSMHNSYLQALAVFMEKFGTVRTLANPRLTVLNNQSAVLKVAHNEVFFELKVEDERNNNGVLTQQKAYSTIRTVPIGLILYVHPSVNFDTGHITVALHPMISRVMAKKNDPAVDFNQQSSNIPASHREHAKSDVPIVQVREMDTIIMARENQVIVTGGLMEEREARDTVDVPYASQIPLLGKLLFENKANERYMTELVVLLKLSIVGNESNMSPADERLYEEFIKDPRPLYPTK